MATELVSADPARHGGRYCRAMSHEVFARLVVIFAVVAIGWAVARAGRLGPGDPARALSAAAFYVFVPALLFRTSARIDFSQVDARLLFAFFLPTLALVGVVYAVARTGRFQARTASSGDPVAAPGVRAITASFGNAVQIGIPVAAALFGEAGLAIHVTIVSLHALVLLTVLTALVEIDLARARGQSAPGATRLLRLLGSTARNTIVHPVVLPVVAGLAWNLSGLALPGLADDLLLTLGAAVVPLCLALIGVSLAQYGVRGALRGAVVLSLVKLLLLPLAVFAVGRFGFGFSGVPLAVIVVMSALPVGSNPLLFAQRYNAQQAETSTAIVVSTLGFVATAPLWLALLAWAG